MSAEYTASVEQPKPETYALDFRTPTTAGILPKYVEQILFKQAKDIARELGEPLPHRSQFSVRTADAVSDAPDAYVRSVTIVTSLSETMREALLAQMLESGYTLVEDRTPLLTIVSEETMEAADDVKEAM